MIFNRTNERILKKIMTNNEKNPKNQDSDFSNFQDRHQQILDDIRQKTKEHVKEEYDCGELIGILSRALSIARLKMDNSHIKSSFSRYLKTDNIDDIEKAYQNYLGKCDTIKLQQYIAFEDLKIDLKQLLREIFTELEKRIDKEQL